MAVVEKLENGLVQLGLDGSGWRFDGDHGCAGEMLAEDMAKVFGGIFSLIGEELALGLEVAQLKYQVNGDRHRAYCRDNLQLGSAQLEEEITVGAGETR